MGFLPESITITLDEALYLLDALDTLAALAAANGDLAASFTAEEGTRIIESKLNRGLPEA